MARILVTGGAGFIGRHVTTALQREGHWVRWLDNLDPQVHGGTARQGATQDCAADDFLLGDVRRRSDWRRALRQIEVVIHLAALTGTGQSMYRVADYTEVNVGGTALLWDMLANERTPVGRVILASSRAIYGEGAYRCARGCGMVVPLPRTKEALQAADWEPACPECAGPAQAVATPETSLPAPASAYAVTKLAQEQLSLAMGRALAIPTVALRLQNVFGPGQSLSNPYTGIISIFSNQLRQGYPIEIYEDGRQSRDMTFVGDVARAFVDCLAPNLAGQLTLNVGSGKATSVLGLAMALKRYWKSSSTITITGAFRIGDVRHQWADLARLSQLWPSWKGMSLARGLQQFVAWAQLQPEHADRTHDAMAELKARGL